MARVAAARVVLWWLGCLVVRCRARDPFHMSWSSSGYGPDGPWQAVTVRVGSPPQVIDLYPGGTFQSHLFTHSVCTNASLGTTCPAQFAGFYNSIESSTSLDAAIKSPGGIDFTDGALNVQASSNGTNAIDQIDIGNLVVPNVSLTLHDSIYVQYPDGTTYPMSVGALGLGAAGKNNQTFTATEGPAINASLIPGYLNVSTTTSNSFGLHIGSVSPKVSGSLVFGGYDQNRVLGNVSTQEPGESDIEMLDIGINVFEGASPWNVSSVSGLMAYGNSSITTVISVQIQPLAPYLDLPHSTCEAIAAWLPVTYQEKYGLYFWNVNDPQYQKIVSSPSALSFTFRKDQSNAENFTIEVPFILLNLTLDTPLIGKPTPYFPCSPQLQGRYSLGRAFLQAAFFGTNWDAYDGNGLWWLAQAPGPNIVAEPDIQSIDELDDSITESTNDWKTSWDGTWKALSGPGPTVSPTPSSSSSADSSSSSGLSAGGKAGIAVGVIFGVIFILAFLFFLHRRRVNSAHRAASLERQSFDPNSEPVEKYTYAAAGFGPREMPSDPAVRELDSRQPNQNGVRRSGGATPITELQ